MIPAPEQQEQADLIAIQTLGFLAHDEELLVGFLSHSGLTPETVRSAAQTPGFLSGVMEYVRERDWLIEEAAEYVGIPISQWVEACLKLSGARVALVQTSGLKSGLPPLPRRALFK